MAQELESLTPQVGQSRERFETAQQQRRRAEQQRDEALALQRQFEARDALAADKARHLEQRAEVDNSQARLAQSTHAQALRPQKAALDQAQQALATAHDEQRQANAALITQHSHAEQAQQALETARQQQAELPVMRERHRQLGEFIQKSQQLSELQEHFQTAQAVWQQADEALKRDEQQLDGIRQQGEASAFTWNACRVSFSNWPAPPLS